MSAESLNSLANDLSDEGRWSEAEQAYLRAAELDARWSVPWYNLGLLYKLQRRWPESIRANQRAVEIDDTNRDAWWNLGIAATAMADWSVARRAWLACGIPIPEGEGPIETDFGPTPVRLNPQNEGEVVWSRRIDPARAVIENIPLPNSGFHEGDIVLHDGAPNGYRKLAGREVPVFDVIQRLTRSPRNTFEAWIEAGAPNDIESLTSAARALEIRVEDWTGSIENLCKACSEGVAHDKHDNLRTVEWIKRRHIGISAVAAHVAEDVLHLWARGAAGRTVIEMRQPEG